MLFRPDRCSERKDEMSEQSFEGISIVSCGTMRKELKRLQEEGFLDADKIFYTTPGLHEIPRDLESQLVRQVGRALEKSDKVMVIYGDRCYVDATDYSRSIDTVLGEQGGNIVRIDAHNCIDMLADAEERDSIAAGRKVYWLVPGWIEFRKNVFLEWDVGKANETFPANDTAILLDPVDYYNTLAAEKPEELLGFSDWMGLGIEPCEVSLDRLKQLLRKGAEKLNGG